MLAVLENVRISGHHQFIIVEVLQVRLKGRTWVRVQIQITKNYLKFISLYDINRTCLFFDSSSSSLLFSPEEQSESSLINANLILKKAIK